MKKILIPGLIVLIAIFFRFYRLGTVPPSPSLDEVSIGWNAYSIMETGRDEYGIRLPVLLRAYDDWRPAFYVYLVIPFIKFLGLTAVAVRLPSVILSLLTILITYLLAQELFRNSKLATRYSLWAAFLLTISPWHVYISRLGHEVNAGLALSVLTIFFFIKAINKEKPILFFLSSFFFALSFYTYQSQKLFGPLIVLALGLVFRKQLWKVKKEVILAGLFGLIIMIPIIRASLAPEALIRFQGTSIFSNQEELFQRASSRIVRDYRENNILGLVFDNQRVAMGLTVLHAYSSHFDPAWLFFNSGAEKHKVPNLGLFYLWELPLLLIGIYYLVSRKFSLRSKILIFSWILIAPLPASIATEAPHAMRIFNLLPVPQLVVALGAMALVAKMQTFKKHVRYLLLASSFLLLLFSFSFLFHNYFINFPNEQSESFQYPLARAVDYVLENENQYQKIIFSNKDHGYQSYMFFLFYSQYDPVLYFDQGGTVSGGYDEAHKIDKYEFRPIEWEKEIRSKDVLYIGNIDDFPKEIAFKQEFKLLNGERAIIVVE